MHSLNFLDNLVLGVIVIFCFTGLIFSIKHEIFLLHWCLFNPYLYENKLIMFKIISSTLKVRISNAYFNFMFTNFYYVI